jgi:uncharacterized protein (DUF488 family)
VRTAHPTGGAPGRRDTTVSTSALGSTPSADAASSPWCAAPEAVTLCTTTAQSLTNWSVGHSNHGLAEFTDVLAGHGIALVADVRAVPKSRRHPHFHHDALERSLPERGVAYVRLRELGGWRRASADSPNDAWRNRSFRAYADYAMSDEFLAGLTRLRELATQRPTAMMCSEALWWRCHRRVIADRLVVAGDTVLHIGSDGRASAHELTSFAAVRTDA